jgi:excisionase family DNA binding protein
MVADNIERLVYTVEEAGELLGIVRSKAYEAANNGELPVIRIGKRILVPKAALDRMLNPLGFLEAADGSDDN